MGSNNLVEKYLKKCNSISHKEENEFVEQFKTKYEISEHKDVFTILAGLKYCAGSKNSAKLKSTVFRSLTMAFKTLASSVELSEKYKLLPQDISKEFKKCGEKYADEWLARIGTLLAKDSDATKITESDFVELKLIQKGSELNNGFWNAQKGYFEELDIQNQNYTYIKKVYDDYLCNNKK